MNRFCSKESFCVVMNTLRAAVAQDEARITPTVLQCTTSEQEAVSL